MKPSRQLINKRKFYVLVLLACFALPAVQGCKQYKCPANTPGYVDPPPKFSSKPHKAKLSNWPKNMKPY